MLKTDRLFRKRNKYGLDMITRARLSIHFLTQVVEEATVAT